MSIKARKRWLVILFIASVLTLLSINVSAGYKASLPVVVTDTYFYGSFGSTRNSTDTTAYMYMYNTGSVVQVVARNSAGAYKACATSDSALISALNSASSDAYMYVGFSNGQCTNVYVYKGSYFEPKTP